MSPGPRADGAQPDPGARWPPRPALRLPGSSWRRPGQAGSAASAGGRSCSLPGPCQRRDEPWAPLGQVSELAEQLEERLFHLYGFHNELIQQRLQALTEVMQSVEEAQAELRHVCCTVEAAYRDLCLQPEP